MIIEVINIERSFDYLLTIKKIFELKVVQIIIKYLSN